MQPLKHIEPDNPVVVAHGPAQHRLVHRLGLAKERRIAASVSATQPEIETVRGTDMLLRTSASVEPSASSASERAGGRAASSSALSQASSAAAVSRAVGLERLGDGRMTASGDQATTTTRSQGRAFAERA